MIDSVATRRMTHSTDVFTEYVQLKIPKVVRTANNEVVDGFGIGIVHVLVLTDVLQTKHLSL